MQEFLLNPVVFSILVAIVVVAVVTIVTLLARLLLTRKQGYPYEEEIEAALRPFIYRAIMLAYKTSEKLVDQNMARLHGLDKKALADWVYNALPNTLYIKGVPIPVGMLKQIISEEQFAGMVQHAFDDFEAWYAGVYANWGSEIENLLDEILQTPASG